jgi:hypothetical protein
VAITLRIPSADMNSYERQQDLQLRAKIVRDSKGPALHNNDRRYHYGLVSTNIDITQAKQLTSLVNSCVDISAYKPE